MTNDNKTAWDGNYVTIKSDNYLIVGFRAAENCTLKKYEFMATFGPASSDYVTFSIEDQNTGTVYDDLATLTLQHGNETTFNGLTNLNINIVKDHVYLVRITRNTSFRIKAPVLGSSRLNTNNPLIPVSTTGYYENIYPIGKFTVEL